MYKRRIRVSSISSSGTGRLTTVRDADMGETIRGVCKIVLTLEGSNLNIAEVTYYEPDDKGHVVLDEEHELIKHTTTVENVEVDDITAFELMDQIRKEMRNE